MRPDRAKVTQGVGFALPWAAILLGFQPVLVFPNRRDVALRHGCPKKKLTVGCNKFIQIILRRKNHSEDFEIVLRCLTCRHYQNVTIWRKTLTSSISWSHCCQETISSTLSASMEVTSMSSITPAGTISWCCSGPS